MKKFLSLTLAVLMIFCSVSIPIFASSATTITIDGETINGNTVTIVGSVSTGTSTPLEILVSKDGNKVIGADIMPNATGQFTYSFDAEETGNYDYVISEKISGIKAQNVFAEDFAEVPRVGTAGCWAIDNLTTATDAGFGTGTQVLKLTKSRYLYDINEHGTNYGDPQSDTTYTVQADFKIDATTKPISMLVFKTVNSGGAQKNYEYINQSGKAEAFQVRAEGTDIVLVYAQNNKLQTTETLKKGVLISHYNLNQKYNIKIEMDLDTLTLKAYVDGARVLEDKDLYIFSQSPGGYRRLFEANTLEAAIESDDTTLYIANVELNRYDKAYKAGSIAYYSEEDVQDAVDYVKSKTGKDAFKAAITEKKDILSVDDSKALYTDAIVLGSVYTDVNANATDIVSFKDILNKAEILYDLKTADKSGDLTAVEEIVKDYDYDIVYSNCSDDTKAALNTAATSYVFSESIAVNNNINGWISAMKLAYSTAIQAEGVSYVDFNAVYSSADGGIKVTGTIAPAASKKLKAVASAESEIFSKEFTTNADGTFGCIIAVQNDTTKDFKVNIEAVNDASTKQQIFSSEFNDVPTEGVVSTATNLSIENGALKLGGGSASRFIVNYSTTSLNSGILCGEAKVKKADTNAIIQLFSLTNSGGSPVFSLSADNSGNFVLKYTEVGATGHLKSQKNLGSYDTTKWYTVGYEVNKANNMVSVFFENKKVLSFKQNTSLQANIDRVIDVNVGAAMGTQYLDSFNCYIDNGTRIYADEKTVNVPTTITEISITEFDGNTATIKSPNSITATLIFATYNGNVLLQPEIKKNYTINQGTNTCSTTLSKDGATKIKVFLWNNLDIIEPLCDGKYSDITQ